MCTRTSRPETMQPPLAPGGSRTVRPTPAGCADRASRVEQVHVAAAGGEGRASAMPSSPRSQKSCDLRAEVDHLDRRSVLRLVVGKHDAALERRRTCGRRAPPANRTAVGAGRPGRSAARPGTRRDRCVRQAAAAGRAATAAARPPPPAPSLASASVASLPPSGLCTAPQRGTKKPGRMVGGRASRPAAARTRAARAAVRRPRRGRPAGRAAGRRSPGRRRRAAAARRGRPGPRA